MLLKARVACYGHASVLVAKGRSLRHGDNAVVQASSTKLSLKVITRLQFNSSVERKILDSVTN